MIHGCGFTKHIANLSGGFNDLFYYAALDHSYFEAVKECVENGANLDYIKSGLLIKRNLSPLKMAMVNNEMKIVKYLLEQGADVNYTDKDDISVFMYAAGAPCIASALESTSYVKLFLQYGADVNKISKDGYSALYFAAQNGNFAMVKLLLKNGANVNSGILKAALEGRHGSGRFHYATEKVILEELEKAGYKSGLDPLLEASILGKSQKVIDLIQSNGVKEENEKQILFNLAAYCNAKAFKMMFRRGFQVNEEDDDDGGGYPLLFVASMFGNLDVVKYLISQGADKNLTMARDTVLNEAVRNGHYDIVEYLIKEKVKWEPVVEETYGENLLSFAAENGDIKMIDLLIDRGYPINNENTYDAVHLAIKYGQVKVVKYFLEKGMSPNLNNDMEGQTLFLYSCLHGNMEIVRLFVEHGADVNGIVGEKGMPLDKAAYSGNQEVVKYLIECGADTDTQYTYDHSNSGYHSALMTATQKGYFDIIKLLVENGAGIEHRYEDTKDSLLSYASGRSTHITAYFVEKGANTNYQNTDGETALMYAADAGLTKNVELLMQSGADVTLKNKDGLTALDIAKKAGYSEIIKILKSKEQTK